MQSREQNLELCDSVGLEHTRQLGIGKQGLGGCSLRCSQSCAQSCAQSTRPAHASSNKTLLACVNCFKKALLAAIAFLVSCERTFPASLAEPIRLAHAMRLSLHVHASRASLKAVFAVLLGAFLIAAQNSLLNLFWPNSLKLTTAALALLYDNRLHPSACLACLK